MAQTLVWTTQVPLNVRRQQEARARLKATYRPVSVKGLDGRGSLTAAALQSGDY